MVCGNQKKLGAECRSGRENRKEVSGKNYADPWIVVLLHIVLFLKIVEKGLQIPVHIQFIHVLIQNMQGLEVHKQEIFFKSKYSSR